MGFLGWFLGGYLVSFALLAFLPGWRTLALGGVVAISFAVWGWHDIGRGDSPAVMLALPLLFQINLGCIAGFLGRALVLFGRPRGWKLSRPEIALPLLLFGVPGTASGWLAIDGHMREARRAPPSQACLERLHPATISGIRLKIPLVPVIKVGLG